MYSTEMYAETTHAPSENAFKCVANSVVYLLPPSSDAHPLIIHGCGARPKISVIGPIATSCMKGYRLLECSQQWVGLICFAELAPIAPAIIELGNPGKSTVHLSGNHHAIRSDEPRDDVSQRRA